MPDFAANEPPSGQWCRDMLAAVCGGVHGNDLPGLRELALLGFVQVRNLVLTRCAVRPQTQ